MDYRRLQEDLRNHYGNFMSLAAIETIKVDWASESELLKLAKHRV